MGEKGGDCRRQGVTYKITCLTCKEERNTQVDVAKYAGDLAGMVTSEAKSTGAAG